MNHSATYSPEDNKLRIYPACRLDPDTYARTRAAGFAWAPKQEVFVAPMWTPEREDFALSLCGEIDDEDTTLIDRAEDRAERFEGYSESRTAESQQALATVAAIADHIPFGQPILVGHHSEGRARRDAERIRKGTERAVNAWKTAEYWTRRAAGAIRAAKYKERPDVRARRIKGLEAELRKMKKNLTNQHAELLCWETVNNDKAWKVRDDGTRPDREKRIAILACKLNAVLMQRGNGLHWTAYDVTRPDEQRFPDCPRMTADEILAAVRKHTTEYEAYAARWIEHYENRLTYERAMYAESEGIAADRVAPEKGGACKCWASPRGGWSLIQKVNKISVTVLDNWDNGGDDFTRTIPMDKLSAVMSRAQVDEARAAGRLVNETARGFHLITGEQSCS